MRCALASCVLLLFLTAGCGPRRTVPDVPDGSSCDQTLATLVVRVVDDTGSPVVGAQVTAVHEGSGDTVTATTQANGVTTAVTESIGAGTVRLRATLGTRVSDQQSTTWTCGECHCTPTPATVTLTLSP